jgi:hypothetical protein
VAEVAHYLFNFEEDATKGSALREQAAALMRLGMWASPTTSGTATRLPPVISQAGVVRITAREYETALAVAAGRALETG